MSQSLKRSIGYPALVLYGLGTMVGGGFYALLGRVAGLAGTAAPVAFLVAGGLAALTAASFAELSSRFPWSAGAAAYVREAFGSRMLSVSVGALVILTGIVSAATLAVASAGFLQEFLPVPMVAGILFLLFAMTALAAWGVDQSVAAVVIITVIEVGALIAVVLLSGKSVLGTDTDWSQLLPAAGVGVWAGIFSGAFLAFYAFLGFEDMVNMAEEVKDVRRVLPRAVVVSLFLTVIIYMLVSVVAVLAVPVEELAAARAPIARIVEGRGWFAVEGLVLVSLLTGLNGALVQIIMASRIAYGMSSRGEIQPWFSAVHPVTRTPLKATLVMGGLAAVFALWLPLQTLAQLTSGIILVVFALVNLSLFRVKRVDPDPDGEGPRLPILLPLAGFMASLAIVVYQIWIVLM